jgi:hypothetical protein
VNSPQPTSRGLSAFLEAKLPAPTDPTRHEINAWFDDYDWLPIKDTANKIIGWRWPDTECELLLPDKPSTGQLLSIGCLAGIEKMKSTTSQRRKPWRPALVREATA